jgi:hypothetical protein
MALESTQFLTEVSSRNISWGLMRPVRGADKLTADCLEDWDPQPPRTLKVFNRPVECMVFLYL